VPGQTPSLPIGRQQASRPTPLQ